MERIFFWVKNHKVADIHDVENKYSLQPSSRKLKKMKSSQNGIRTSKQMSITIVMSMFC